MRKELLNYRVIEDFHNEFYKDLITEEHILNDGQLIRLNKIISPGGGEEYEFWGWQFKKSNKTYILSVYDDHDNEIILKDILPIRIKSERKVGYQKEVFHEITNYSSAKFRPLKHYSLKQIVNYLSQLSHSNPTHYKLNFMTELTSYFDSFVCRKATVAGFSKDSTLQIFNSLFGRFHSVAMPSVAKLSYEVALCKNLSLNEMTSWRKECIELIEPIILAVSDGKPTVQKNTRAGYGVGDTINIQNLSMELFYNDINCYNDMDKYIDFFGNSAVPDRFIPFRFYGRINEDFSKYAILDTKKLAIEGIEEYKRIIETLEYYKKNYITSLHNYDRSKLHYADITKRSRWLTHVHKLLNVVDLCSDSQEEFDKWIEVICTSINDYHEMLSYPTMLISLYNKMKIPKGEYEKFRKTKIEDAKHYLINVRDKYKEDSSIYKEINEKVNFTQSIINTNTFTDKNKMINCYSTENVIKDKVDVEW